MPRTILLDGQRATDRLAAAVMGALSPGCVVLLKGELGAGKTRFVRGALKAAGASDQVTSPTFTLMNVYDTARWPVYHMDLYRLADEDEFICAGLMDALDGDGVSFIEWPERAWDILITRAQLVIELTRMDGDARAALLSGPLEGLNDVKDWGDTCP